MKDEDWEWVAAMLTASGRPWPDGVAAVDYRWLNAGPERFGRTRLASRWNMSDRAARRLIQTLKGAP